MFLRRIAVFAFGIAFSAAALAQAWPQKPVRIIVPFVAGGVTDVVARVVGEKLSAAWGQPVIVENRPGAGGSLGAAEAARAAPDGYTLFFPSGSVMTANQYIYEKRSYDPEKDFVPVTNVVTGPMVLIVAANSPYQTTQDFLRAAKAAPGKFSFGHAGVGSQTHLVGESFVHAAGIDAISVPYKGDPPAALDVASGQIHFGVLNLAVVVGLVNGGKLRALGVTSMNEAPQLPGVAPIAKTLPGFENSGWFGIVARAGTPQDIIRKVYEDTRTALQDTHVKARFYALGLTTVGNSPEEMGKAMAAERVRWATVVRERKIQVK
jgi:tripartite-type tricarboxylate transporter receptor subunit TctC